MDDYSLLDVFFTMLMFFLWITWLVLVFHIVVDIFRNEELGGFGKAGWLLLVLVLPFVGVLLYLVVQGRSMNRRAARLARVHAPVPDAYPAAAPSGNDARDLERLADLHRSGALTEVEYEQAKHRILAV